MLAATWGLVGAVQTGALQALNVASASPTPTATPPLAAAVYAHVAPSVVEVVASGASSESALGAGVIVDDAADVLTSLHIVDGATQVTLNGWPLYSFAGDSLVRPGITSCPDDNLRGIVSARFNCTVMPSADHTAAPSRPLPSGNSVSGA